PRVGAESSITGRGVGWPFQIGSGATSIENSGRLTPIQAATRRIAAVAPVVTAHRGCGFARSGRVSSARAARPSKSFTVLAGPPSGQFRVLVVVSGLAQSRLAMAGAPEAAPWRFVMRLQPPSHQRLERPGPREPSA